MDARQAILSAKKHFAEIFADEGVTDVGLEEVRYDDDKDVWLITLGYAPLRDPGPSIAALVGRYDYIPRTYKLVEVDDADGRLIAIKHRNVGAE